MQLECCGETLVNPHHGTAPSKIFEWVPGVCDHVIGLAHQQRPDSSWLVWVAGAILIQVALPTYDMPKVQRMGKVEGAKVMVAAETNFGGHTTTGGHGTNLLIRSDVRLL